MIVSVPLKDLPVFVGKSLPPPHLSQPVSSHASQAAIVAELGLAGLPEVVIDCDYLPGTPDVYTLPNGDPGHPGTPAELDIHSITCAHALVWKEGGFTLTADPHTDLRELFSEKDWQALEQRVEALVVQHLADDEGDARIDAYMAAHDLY